MQGLYTKEVIDHFKNPHNIGEIENPDGIGKVGNPICGDMMWAYIKVKDGKIVDIKMKTFGCVAAIASTDYLCEIVKGKTLEQALKITSKDVVKKMGKVPSIKLHCSVLAQNALKKAIQDYKKKKQ